MMDAVFSIEDYLLMLQHGDAKEARCVLVTLPFLIFTSVSNQILVS
jgi:hypothetical protein